MIEPTKLQAIALPPDQRWSILDNKSVKIMGKLSGGTEHWIGRKGVTADLNGAYFVRLLGVGRKENTVRIRTNPAGSRKFVPLIEHDIERDLIYPLLKGASQISAFSYKPIDLVAIIPNEVITSIPSVSEFRKRYPLAYRYFQRLNKELDDKGVPLLEGRSTWRTRMQVTNAPFFAIYNVGDYTFRKYKVVWAEMSSSIKAAVVTRQDLPYGLGKKVVIPDHKVYFAATDHEDEAFYLCGMLNSHIVRTFIDSFTLKLQVGTLFKHLYLPSFVEDNQLHREIIQVSRQAHTKLITPDMQHKLDIVAQKIIEEK